ncbi:MAG: IclR family transcriptional regulator C-terminal domain-containing protein [Burkholderiales bacterium]
MTRRSPGASPARKPPATAEAAPSAASEIASMSGDPDFMTSLARGLAVIQGFTQQKRSLTIAQLSHRTGIPRAAVRRCLYTLGKLGLVGSDDGRTFSLLPKILTLGHAYLSSSTLATFAQPLLDRVSERSGESSSIAILDGTEIIYVARSSITQRIMSVDLSIGTRLPAYCTSMGRALLADLAPSELDAYLRRVKLVAHTPRTIVAPDRLRKALADAAKDGYAVVDQELELGLRSIAVPVRNASGRVAAAMNISTQASRVPLQDLTRRLLPELTSAARELSSMLL